MRLITSLIILVILVSACRQKTRIPDNFDYGKVENGVYTNRYFNFELPVPKNWDIQNKQQMEELTKLGREVIGEKNKELASQLKASEVNSASLLTVFKNPVDSVTGEFNPSFSLAAENLARFPNLSTGQKYLEQTKTLMKKSGLTYSFGEIRKEKLGNREFERMDVVMTVRGVDVHQSYYVTIDKQFALCVVLSAVDDEQKESLKEIVGRIKFM